MNCCHHQHGLNQVFTPDIARREAKQFRKKGLNKRDRRLLRSLVQRGVQDATVLEVGGGVGGLQVELLRAGAAHATDVDIAEAYVASARELAQSLGLSEKSEQHALDFAREARQVAPADIVIMNRVVCCYPDMPALVAPAAQHAQRLLALVFPREAWWMQLGARLINMGMWLLRRDFRFFVHSHQAMLALVRDNGLHAVEGRLSGVWRQMLFERT